MREVALSEHGPGVGRIFIALGTLLLVGAPAAAVAWHELSHLLSGRISVRGLLLMVAALALFAGIAAVLKRYVVRLEDEDGEKSPRLGALPHARTPQPTEWRQP